MRLTCVYVLLGDGKLYWRERGVLPIRFINCTGANGAYSSVKQSITKFDNTNGFRFQFSFDPLTADGYWSLLLPADNIDKWRHKCWGDVGEPVDPVRPLGDRKLFKYKFQGHKMGEILRDYPERQVVASADGNTTAIVSQDLSWFNTERDIRSQDNGGKNIRADDGSVSELSILHDNVWQVFPTSALLPLASPGFKSDWWGPLTQLESLTATLKTIKSLYPFNSYLVTSRERERLDYTFGMGFWNRRLLVERPKSRRLNDHERDLDRRRDHRPRSLDGKVMDNVSSAAIRKELRMRKRFLRNVLGWAGVRKRNGKDESAAMRAAAAAGGPEPGKFPGKWFSSSLFGEAEDRSAVRWEKEIQVDGETIEFDLRDFVLDKDGDEQQWHLRRYVQDRMLLDRWEDIFGSAKNFLPKAVVRRKVVPRTSARSAERSVIASLLNLGSSSSSSEASSSSEERTRSEDTHPLS